MSIFSDEVGTHLSCTHNFKPKMLIFPSERRHRASTQSRHSSTPGPERERSKTVAPMTNGTKPLPADPTRDVRSSSVGKGKICNEMALRGT